MHLYAFTCGLRVPRILSYTGATRQLVMEHVVGSSIADWYGEDDADTPAHVYQQVRVLMEGLAQAGISYPDITGYNIMHSVAADGVEVDEESNNGLVLIDMEHSELGTPCEFMRRFIDGHDGWNPEFR